MQRIPAVLAACAVLALSSSTFVRHGAEASPTRTDVTDAPLYNDLPQTVFSPTGRLRFVERKQMEVEIPSGPSNLVVALQTSEGIVVVSTVPVSPYLPSVGRSGKPENRTAGAADEDAGPDASNATASSNASVAAANASHSTLSLQLPFLVRPSAASRHASVPTAPFTVLSPHPVVIATGGSAADGRVLRHHIRSIAEASSSLSLFETDTLTLGTDTRRVSAASPPSSKRNDVHTPDNAAAMLARMTADSIQIATQTIGSEEGIGELLASAALIVQAANPSSAHGQLWRVDPTGQFWRCQAAVVGCNANRARAELLQALQEHVNASSTRTNHRSDRSNGTESTKTDCTSSPDQSVSERMALQSMTLDDAVRIAERCLKAATQRPFGISLSRVSNYDGEDSEANPQSSSDTDGSSTSPSQSMSPIPTSTEWEAIVLPATAAAQQMTFRRGVLHE